MSLWHTRLPTMVLLPALRGRLSRPGAQGGKLIRNPNFYSDVQSNIAEVVRRVKSALEQRRRARSVHEPEQHPLHREGFES